MNQIKFIKLPQLVSILAICMMFVLSCSSDEMKVTPGRLNTLIALTRNSRFVLHSTDNGTTWEKITIPNTINDAVYKGDKVWIAGGENAILKSDDDGLTWTKVLDPKVDLGDKVTEGLRITSLWYDPSTGQIAAIGSKTVNVSGITVVDGYRVLLSDNGEEWTTIDLSSAIPLSEGQSATFHDIVIKGDVIVTQLILKTKNKLGNFENLSLVESTDKGKNWKNVPQNAGFLKGFKVVGDDIMATFDGKTLQSTTGVLGIRKGDAWTFNGDHAKDLLFGKGDDDDIYGLIGKFSRQPVRKSDDWNPSGGTSLPNINVTNIIKGGDEKYILIGGGMNIYFSKDFIEWKSVAVSKATKINQFHTGIYKDGRFIITGGDYSSKDIKPSIFTSEDGVAWVESTIPELTVEQQIFKILN